MSVIPRFHKVCHFINSTCAISVLCTINTLPNPGVLSQPIHTVRLCRFAKTTQFGSSTHFGVLKLHTVIYSVQRNVSIRFQKCAEIDAIIETIGIDKSDLTSLYYYALDCGLLASTTTNESWRSDLEKYHEALLAYIHSHCF